MEAVDLLGLLLEIDRTVQENPLPVESPVVVEERGNFVVFRSSGSTFGVAVEAVSAVLKTPPVCTLPQAPSWLLGVIAWAGDVVPLVTMTAATGMQPAGASAGVEPGNSRCLVLATGDLKLALQVAEVVGVRRLSPDSARGEGSSAGGLSEVLRWKADPQETVGQAPGVDSGERPDPALTEVRVLSLVGLLASEEITRFANRAALEAALASGSRARPYGGVE